MPQTDDAGHAPSERTPAPSRLAFVARFLAAFALITSLAGALHLTSAWGNLLFASGRSLHPVLTGWQLERRPGPPEPSVWLTGSRGQMRFEIGLDKLALGLFPFLSLIAATPGLTTRRRLASIAAGFLGFYALDLTVVLSYPSLVTGGALADISGTFLGLLAFVGAPVILWFVLTFDAMGSVWRFPTR